MIYWLKFVIFQLDQSLKSHKHTCFSELGRFCHVSNNFFSFAYRILNTQYISIILTLGRPQRVTDESRV